MSISKRLVAPGTLLLATLALVACGSDGEDQIEYCDLVPGDLVITEIMANPAGADENQEWIEIYNASGRRAALNGLVVEQVTTSTKPHTIRSSRTIFLAAGAYYVLSDGASDFVDYDYGSSLGGLNNTAATLRLVCQGRQIDSVAYGEDAAAPAPSDGVAASLDGSVPPDAIANDQQAAWCDAVDFYGPVNLGSPGGPNPPCGSAFCQEAGSLRESAPPVFDDLVITEIYANPLGSDGDGEAEYIELYVAASAPIDINGLRVVNSNATSTREFSVASQEGPLACVTVQPGSYILLAGDAATDLNGNLPEVTALLVGASMYNSSEPMSVAVYLDDMLLDQAPYPTPGDGVASSLSDDRRSTVANDDPANWCAPPLTTPFAGQGTPGSPNGICGALYCQDGADQRIATTPLPGDLVISEVFADPTGADGDGDAEWIEIFVAATTSVDLAGLVVRSYTATANRSFAVRGPGCFGVSPGSYVVLAGSDASTDNGDLPQVDGLLDGDALYNPNDGTSLTIGHGDIILDAAPYRATAEGISTALDASLMTTIDNDNTSLWNAGTCAGLFDGLGTPGMSNDACP